MHPEDDLLVRVGRAAPRCGPGLLGRGPGGDAAARPYRQRARASAEVSGAAGTIGKATARCPAGTSVVSGGVRTFANIQLEGDARVLIPYISRRSGPRAWTVAVYSVGEPIANPKRFFAIAYCRKGLGRLVARSRRGAAVVGSGGRCSPSGASVRPAPVALGRYPAGLQFG